MKTKDDLLSSGIKEYEVTYQVTIFEERSLIVKATSEDVADDIAYTKLHGDAGISEIDIDSAKIKELPTK